PVPRPPYTWVRTVMGAVVLPAVMKRSLAALLMSWSAAMPMKSMIMISATGSRPSIAAPTAAPTIAASEIGVSSTRSWPYFVDSPAVGPDAPGSAMSSPSRNTRSSARSAWSSARFSASRIVISFSSMCLPSDRVGDRGRVHVPVEFLDRGGVGAHDRLQRHFDLGERTFVDAAQLVVGADTRVDQLPSEPRHGIRRDGRLQLILRAVRHPVAEVVAAEAKRHTLEESGAITSARPGQRRGERIRHGQWVVAVDANTRHAVAGRPVGDVLELHRVHGWRHLRVLVVLAHEDHRQVPERCHVRRLVEGPGVCCAVAEADTGDPGEPLALGGHCEPDGHGRTSADDPGREHHTRLRLGDVHRAALAAAPPGGGRP